MFHLLPQEIINHILSFLSYEEIREKFSDEQFSDSFWKRKALREWNIPESFFDRFRSFGMSSEERYVQLGINFRDIDHNFSFFSSWAELMNCCTYSNPERFEKFREKIDPSEHALSIQRFAWYAAEQENFSLSSYLDPTNENIFDSLCYAYGWKNSCILTKSIAIEIYLSQPENLQIFDVDFRGSVIEHDPMIQHFMLLSINSRSTEKSRANLRFFDRHFPDEKDTKRNEVIYCMLQSPSPEYTPYIEKISNQTVFSEFLSKGELSSSPLIKSLLPERIDKFLGFGLKFQVCDFDILSTCRKDKIVEKCAILERYLFPGNEAFFSYSGAKGSSRQCKGWTNQQIIDLAISFAEQGEIDLIWILVRRFPFILKINLDQMKLVEKQKLLLRCFSHWKSQRNS